MTSTKPCDEISEDERKKTVFRQIARKFCPDGSVPLTFSCMCTDSGLRASKVLRFPLLKAKFCERNISFQDSAVLIALDWDDCYTEGRTKIKFIFRTYGIVITTTCALRFSKNARECSIVETIPVGCYHTYNRMMCCIFHRISSITSKECVLYENWVQAKTRSILRLIALFTWF